MLIYAFSDTHNNHEKVKAPKCDILIHAGDATNRGSPQELYSFLNWFSKQDAKYKVLVPGNHDWGFEKNPEQYKYDCAERGITLLNDEMAELDGLKIWGSPIQPFFCNWAFNRWPGPDIQKHWDLIPKGMDIVVTHGPPKGFLDENLLGQQCGCDQLLYRILEVQPKAHIFGHIHENNGVKEFNGIKFYNVACCDERYSLEYQPMEIIL